MELCIVIPFLKDPHYQMYYIMNSFLSQVIVALLTLCNYSYYGTMYSYSFFEGSSLPNVLYNEFFPISSYSSTLTLCIVIPFLKDPHYQMYYIMNSFLSQVIVALLTLCNYSYYGTMYSYSFFEGSSLPNVLYNEFFPLSSYSSRIFGIVHTI